MIRLIFGLGIALISHLLLGMALKPTVACPLVKAPAVSCRVQGGDKVRACLRHGKLYIKVLHVKGIGRASITLSKPVSAIEIHCYKFARLEGFTAGSGNLQLEKIETNTSQRQFQLDLNNAPVRVVDLSWVDAYR